MTILHTQLKNTLQNKVFLLVMIFSLLILGVIARQTYASAPTVTTNPATITSSTQAALNGFINPGGLYTSFWFELGEAGSGSFDAFGNGNLQSARNVRTGIAQLDREQTYNFRLVAQNADGKAYGETLSFSIKNGSSGGSTGGTTTYYNNSSNTTNTNTGGTAFGQTPIVNTAYATNVTDTGVSLNGYVDPNGGSNVCRWFEWGTTQSLGNISGNAYAGTNPNYFSQGISGLERNTTYYFRAAAHSNGGTVYGTIFSFTTGTSAVSTSGVAPILMIKQASYVSAQSAQLNAVVIKGGVALTNGYFEWGVSPQSLGNTTQTQSIAQDASANMSVVLQNLLPSTSYSYRAVVQDARSAVYRSEIITFNTASIAAAGGTTATNVSGGSSQVTKKVVANTVAATKKSDTTTSNNDSNKNSSGAAGIFFAQSSMALLGWFLSIILFMVVIIMGVMLRRSGKKEEEPQVPARGFKEFPDIPGHPVNIVK